MSLKEKDPLALGHRQEGASSKNTFNIHKALSEYKFSFPLPAIAEIYRNPILTAGSVGIYPPFDNESQKNNNGFLLNNFENLSLDNISILFNSPPIHSDNPTVKKFWRVFDKMIDMGDPLIQGEKGIYNYSVKWFGDFIIQWGNKNINKGINTIRLEFNPNKAHLPHLVLYFACFKGHKFDYARVSRLDVAIDYAMYLNPLCWLVSGVSLGQNFTFNNVIKTRYYGSKQSDLQLRIYDKAHELKSKSKIDLDFDLWRVEAQIRAINGESFSLTGDYSIFEFNPFDRLSFDNPYNFKFKGQGGYNLFVLTARAYGVDIACSNVDHKTRKKYLARLEADIQESVPFNSPAKIYRNCFKDTYIRFVNQLLNLFEKGQGYTPSLMKL